jgi:hypothetical protein
MITLLDLAWLIPLLIFGLGSVLADATNGEPL